jgi:tRNA-2-methylthio-N6-dimethylallyladenosine synthase
VRGRQKSRAIEAVLAECRELIIRGARELTLLGQNVNAYGQDLNGAGVGFASLLRRVAALPGLDRLRFITSHPKDIDPEVIAAFGQLPNLCPQLHLPLQSGSDAILASMGRKYDRARYLEVVAGLRSARPDLALSTDFIVGFPGETEADFEQTLAMMREVGFSASFSFKYNDRPGVRAANMEPKVPEAVKTERLSRLQALQDELAAADRAARVGNEAEVLFEGMSRKPGASGASYSGRDPWGRTVNVAGGEGNDLTGLLARVRIDKVKKHSLTGTLLGVPW